MRRAIISAAIIAMTSAHPASASSDSVESVTEPEATVDPRVSCIELKESGGANVWRGNTPPVYGDKPAGVLQYFESTFRRGAVEMGHPDWDRWVPWQARMVADHDLAMGRRRQWTVLGC